MEDDVINTTLYPTGYTPPVETGEVSDQQMMQSGDGDLVIDKQMMQATACVLEVVDSYEFDATDCVEPSPIHLDGDYYAVVYQGPSNHGWLKTFTITTAGTITEVDDWEFDTNSTERHHIDHISGTLYALSYEINNVGYLKTLNISDTGVITESFLSEWNFGDQKYEGKLFNVFGNVYTLFGSVGSFGRTYIKTCSITSEGIIASIDSYSYAATGYFCYGFTQVNSNVYFSIVSEDDDIVVITVHVANDGTITTPYVDLQRFTESNPAHAPLNVAEVATGVFVVPLWHNDGYSGLGHVHTFGIDSDGNIENDLLDSLEFGTSGFAACRGKAPDIQRSSTGDVFFVVYTGIGVDEETTDGLVRTINITDAGVITDYPHCDPYEFETGVMSEPQALPMRGSCFPVFYKGADDDGWVKSIRATGV